MSEGLLFNSNDNGGDVNKKHLKHNKKDKKHRHKKRDTLTNKSLQESSIMNASHLNQSSSSSLPLDANSLHHDSVKPIQTAKVNNLM